VSLPTYAKNEALAGWTFTHASLHSGYPGITGANEVSGGAYARKSVNVSAPVGGQRSLAASIAFTVPATTIRWVGWWDDANFLGATPNGGATPKNFVSLASDDRVYCVSHGYADGTKVVFWLGTAPPPLVTGSIYYVRDAATDSFKVAETLGGTAIDLTSAPSFGCVVSSITEKTYSAPATHTVTVGTFLIPD
jgi:hypothetical protein